MAEPSRLLFAAQTSKVSAETWAAIGEKKLKELKLDIGPFDATEAPVEISLGQPRSRSQSPPDSTAAHAAREAANAESHALHVPTLVFAFNNAEDLSKPSCNVILDTVGNDIWSAITSKQALRKPELLTPCVLIVHCDLKRHSYRHRCAFPHLVGATPYMYTDCQRLESVQGGVRALETAAQQMPAGRAAPVLAMFPTDTGGVEDVSLSVKSLEPLAKLDGKWPADLALAAPDPSPHDNVPGWPFRNYLSLLAHMFPGESVRLLAMRARGGKFDAACSLLFTVKLPDADSGWAGGPCPRVGGWEGGKGSNKWKEAQLADTLDPHAQARAAMALNLDLMKWRAAPRLDLDAISSKRCLLLGMRHGAGCGTLGCEVARTLLAWGVQDLHLVDNGRVAFSNPVRQSLFTFDDCLEGGRGKAEAAADMLLRACPSARVQATALTIPMPGHPPAGVEIEPMQQDVETLDGLVEAADVVFMLTDSRESRWLPSTLAAAKGKLLINAALGFDSWIVMRHGRGPLADAPGERLGCYFCNDVVAPANSTAGRSLDEQCTVVRPGLARIAAATAVEMFAALAQHADWLDAPALDEGAAVARMGRDGDGPVLGGVPHMLRGCLTGFTQTHMRGVANARCSACSRPVVERYLTQGAAFALQVTQEDDCLEVVSGLKELQLQAAAAPAESAGEDDWEAL